MWSFLKKISLTKWILISMLFGALVGFYFPQFSQNLNLISQVFLRMIKTIIVPLLFGTLVVGIAGHGNDIKSVGRLALKSMIYFEIVTTIALFIGLGAVWLTQPGVGVNLKSVSVNQVAGMQQHEVTLKGLLEQIVPKSFIEAAANNDVLQVVFFAIIFALALS
ncbi:MAG: cation:dicarboxylase symporter family transporter, partial [FCB group bacterium]